MLPKCNKHDVLKTYSLRKGWICKECEKEIEELFKPFHSNIAEDEFNNTFLFDEYDYCNRG